MPRRSSTHIDDPVAVGRRLRQARQAAGLSQRRLSFEGCTSAYISRIEAGARVPSLQVLREFGRKLGVSAEYLATGRDVAEPDDDSALLHAELMLQTGDADGARRAYAELVEAAPSTYVVAAARAGLGQLAFRRGDHERAIEELSEALASPLLRGRARTGAIDSLGRALVHTGRNDEALALFEHALAEAKARNDVLQTIRFSVLLASTLVDRGGFARAEQVLAEPIGLGRDAVDPVARARILWSQSRLHATEGRADLAATYARQALETLEVTEHALYVAKALVLAAQLENERGHAREALELVEEALPSIAVSGDEHEQGLALLEKARALAGLGEKQEAIAVALGTIGLFRGAAPASAGQGYTIAASLCVELGEDARAAELFELAIEVLPADDRHRVEALRSYAALLERIGKRDEAFELLKRALDVRAPAPQLAS